MDFRQEVSSNGMVKTRERQQEGQLSPPPGWSFRNEDIYEPRGENLIPDIKNEFFYDGCNFSAKISPTDFLPQMEGDDVREPYLDAVDVPKPEWQVLWRNPDCWDEFPEPSPLPEPEIEPEFLSIPVPPCDPNSNIPCVIDMEFGYWIKASIQWQREPWSGRLVPIGTFSPAFTAYAGNYKKAVENRGGLLFTVDASWTVYNNDDARYPDGRRIHPNFQEWENEGFDPNVGSVSNNILTFQRGQIVDAITLEGIQGEPPVGSYTGNGERQTGYQISRFSCGITYRCSDIVEGKVTIRKPKIYFSSGTRTFFDEYGNFSFEELPGRLYSDFPWTVVSNSCDPRPPVQPPPPPPRRRFPPPKDCCMCCPRIDTSANDRLLRLILQRIGTPTGVFIYDENPGKKGAQSTERKPQTLFAAAKLATERVELNSRITGIAAFPVEVPDTVVQPYKDGIFAKVFDFIDGNKVRKLNSVAEFIAWQAEQDSATTGQFHQVIEIDSPKGKTPIVLPNIASTLREIILLLTQMARNSSIDMDANIRTLVETADIKTQLAKVLATVVDIQDYLDYPTNEVTTQVPVAINIPSPDKQKGWTDKQENFDSLMRNSYENITYHDWTGEMSMQDMLSDILNVMAMLKAIIYQRTDV